jgi:hypothetical protein
MSECVGRGPHPRRWSPMGGDRGARSQASCLALVPRPAYSPDDVTIVITGRTGFEGRAIALATASGPNGE